MKIFILKKFFAAIIISAVLCVSCSDDDGPKNPADALSISINADGSTSTGASFAPVSNDAFYLDHILYKIVDSHLEVIGYDHLEIKQEVKIYSPINYFGITYNVRRIRNEVFDGCKKITSVSLPNCIQDIGSSAFRDCTNLKYINIPTELLHIPQHCFEYCANLTGIKLPNNITSVKEFAFSHCSKLGNIIIPSSCKSIEDAAFMDCGDLGNLTIPSSCKVIGLSTFENCKFNTVKIEDGVKYIFCLAFAYCYIDEITLPKTLIYIEDTHDPVDVYHEHHNRKCGTNAVFADSHINKVIACFPNWDAFDLINFFRFFGWIPLVWEKTEA